MSLLEKILTRRPDNLIYHYTSQKGLIGIIESRSIWATDVRYLNDSEEFTFAINLARDVIEDMGASSSSDTEEQWFEQMNSALDRTLGNTFVCSFSEEKDLLSQWRGYCPDGIGFSVGFDYDRLQPLIGNQGFYIAPCIYDINLQVQLIRECIESIITKSLSYPIPYDSSKLRYLSDFQLQFIELAPILKHPNFSEEREWRIISKRLKAEEIKVKFREGKSMLVPYYVFNLDSMVIREIIAGPSPHKDLSIAAVAQLLKSTFWNEPRVWQQEVKGESSKIPYRRW